MAIHFSFIVLSCLFIPLLFEGKRIKKTNLGSKPAYLEKKLYYCSIWLPLDFFGYGAEY